MSKEVPIEHVVDEITRINDDMWRTIMRYTQLLQSLPEGELKDTLTCVRSSHVTAWSNGLAVRDTIVKAIK